eukprot:TRINITY_DN3247_c0_g1_i5.p1 TRINITY_DN3247_c0_g1~~TRINITY_DN3247_c0_g1_i5.p1  ORF type:complete len:543 (+),score=145.07 TRINITY_DN3247_c0_g1_i5:92-1720(+)
MAATSSSTLTLGPGLTYSSCTNGSLRVHSRRCFPEYPCIHRLAFHRTIHPRIVKLAPKSFREIRIPSTYVSGIHGRTGFAIVRASIGEQKEQPTITEKKQGDETQCTEDNVLGGVQSVEKEDNQDEAQKESDGNGGQSDGLFSILNIWKKKEPSPTPPGREPPPVRLPKDVVDVLRSQVFGFDTFFVTEQEPYQAGVLFRGNMRGDSKEAFAKLDKKLQEKYGDRYLLYLLASTDENGKPVAVVVPKESVLPEGDPPVPEWLAASAFAAVAFLTILLRNSPTPEFGFLPSTEYLAQYLLEGLPGSLLMLLILLAHEAGHIYAAKATGIELGLPFVIPSYQLGVFGAITRFKNVVQNRDDLIKVAAAGPLVGGAAALLLVLGALLLTAAAGTEGGIPIQSTVFHDSLLVGGLAKLILGDRLVENAVVGVSPLLLPCWTGLLINAINCIPLGELDGGRIALGIWGRKGAARLSTLSLLLLGVTGIFNDVALFWVILVIFLQRGPIVPQRDEVSAPDRTRVGLGLAVLLLGLTVCFPYPFPFSSS